MRWVVCVLFRRRRTCAVASAVIRPVDVRERAIQRFRLIRVRTAPKRGAETISVVVLEWTTSVHTATVSDRIPRTAYPLLVLTVIDWLMVESRVCYNLNRS